MQPGTGRALAHRARGIDGWFVPEAAELFGAVDEVQRVLGARGDLFEIGVHHGKSAVVLAHMLGPGESLAVCDLFGDQELNASGSGVGDRGVFTATMRRLAPGVEPVVHQALSSSLTAQAIGGPFRFFHVDGGHHPDEARGDLELAAATLHPRGAIVIDDPYSPPWPGVTEGILAFLAAEPDWVPLVMGFNKLVIVRRDAHAAYAGRLLESGAIWRWISPRIHIAAEQPIAGHPTTILYVPTWLSDPRAGPLLARGLRVPSAARRLLSRSRR